MSYSPPGLNTPQTKSKKPRDKKVKTEDSPASSPASSLTSFELQFAQDLMSGKSSNPEIQGLWALKCEARSTVGRPFHWNETYGYWDYVHTTEGVRYAAAWMKDHYPDKATPRYSKSLWEYTLMILNNTLPELNEKLNLIPTKSGYMKVHANGQIELIKPDPNFGIDWLMDVSIANAPGFGQKFSLPTIPSNSLFGRYLDSSLPNPEVRKVVQEMVAQTFMSENYQTCGWFIGEAGSGKSVMLELIAGLHRRTCSLELHKMDKDHALEGMIDASLIVIDEVKQSKFDEEKFKPIISQNKIVINPKYGAVITFTPKSKMLVASNQPAIITDKSSGVWRRIVFIPWTQRPKRIDDLDKKILQTERHLVLSWIVEGIARITQRGGLLEMRQMPFVIQAENEFLRENADSVLSWIESAGVKASSTSSMVNYEVFRSYQAWAEESGIDHPLEQSNFFKALKSHVPDAFPSKQRVWINRQGRKAKDRFYSISIGFEEDKTPAELLEAELDSIPYAPGDIMKLINQPAKALH